MRRFSFVFELRCLCKVFARYRKDIFKNFHQQSKNKSSAYIIVMHNGNNENHTQKSLIPTQNPNRFDHKPCKVRRILKFESVFTINNGDCDARWSMSFCLSTRMNNVLGMNQTKYLIRPIIMIITLTRIKNKARK